MNESKAKENIDTYAEILLITKITRNSKSGRPLGTHSFINEHFLSLTNGLTRLIYFDRPA